MGGVPRRDNLVAAAGSFVVTEGRNMFGRKTYYLVEQVGYEVVDGQPLALCSQYDDEFETEDEALRVLASLSAVEAACRRQRRGADG